MSRPTAEVLHRIISDLLGPDAQVEDVVRCQVSVIGQCFHYAVARPIISRIVPLDITATGFIEQLAQHITRFSLAGIAAVKKAGEESDKG